MSERVGGNQVRALIAPNGAWSWMPLTGPESPGWRTATTEPALSRTATGEEKVDYVTESGRPPRTTGHLESRCPQS
jgi:hypothetical protein